MSDDSLVIITYPDSFLTKPTIPYVPDGGKSTVSDLIAISSHLRSTIRYTSNAIALAANQVGLTVRMFGISPSLADILHVSETIVNPTFVARGEYDITELEGCLSFPGVSIRVKRAHDVVYDYLTVTGEPRRAILSGLGARVFQHECEHLDGKLFTDNIGRIEQYRILSKMRKKR